MNTQGKLKRIAQKYKISSQTVEYLYEAIAKGKGTMAQFNLPELGGMGQWMKGGMTMVGDLFNNSLKAKVDQLCTELSTLYAIEGPLTKSEPKSVNWWPDHFGHPTISGAQNDLSYAFFPSKRRLLVQLSGQIYVFNTLDHQVSGVSQKQGGGLQSIVFTSQKGKFRIDVLGIIN